MSSELSLDASPTIKAAVSSWINESALSGFRSQTPHYLLAFTAPSRIAAGVWPAYKAVAIAFLSKGIYFLLKFLLLQKIRGISDKLDTSEKHTST